MGAHISLVGRFVSLRVVAGEEIPRKVAVRSKNVAQLPQPLTSPAPDKPAGTWGQYLLT